MRIVDYEDLNGEYFSGLELVEIPIVKKMLEDVKENGDSAIKKYTKQFDGVSLESLEISKQEIKKAYEEVDAKVIDSIKNSVKNIKQFADEQFKQLGDFEIGSSVAIGQKVIPIQSVGCYVPGGLYPLPSSALMSVIPAKVAGVDEIIVCSPKIQQVTIVAANIAGADRIFNVGGVQAIGGMAYGTTSIPKVDKIVGPGNKYVQAAKKEVYGTVGIDFIAGPSEVLIIADETAKPEFIAADLLAQAEHDINARPDLITTSIEVADAVNVELEKQLINLKTKDIAGKALENGNIVIVENIDQAIEISNKRAAEHLELQIKDPDLIISKLVNYGSLFIGSYSAEVFGDYCSGTNHILPTNGAARYTGGLSVFDFVKVLTYQNLTEEGATELSEVAANLASVEGLDGHKKAAEIRLP